MSVHESLSLNATNQPLTFSGEFTSVEEYLEYQLHLRAYEEVASMVRGQRVLDLGCNNGYGTAHIQPACASIVGVDVSASAVADGLRRFAGRGLRLEVFDGRTLPFADSSFDVVVSLQVIEHIDLELIPQYLGEATRVLRAGGAAVFTTPNGTVRVLPGTRPWNEYHVREFSADELKQELSRFFEAVDVKGLFGSPPVQERFLRTYRAAQQASRAGSARSVLRKRLPWLVPLVRWARGLRRVPMTPEQLAQYSTKDFHYAADRVDSALDLLAVCRKSSA